MPAGSASAPDAPRPAPVNDLAAMREYRRMRTKGAPVVVSKEAAVQKRRPTSYGRGIHAPK